MMLIEVDSRTYKQYFPTNPHVFISEQFIELNKSKVEGIVRLIENCQKPSLGLIAGIRDGVLFSPFSAPFGGFHFLKQNIYISEIDNFINSLKGYIAERGFKKIELVLPPDIYHSTFNAKTINSLIRNQFECSIPEITNWIDLRQFNGSFTQRNSREYYQQAVRKGLIFSIVNDDGEKSDVFELILKNRERFGRPIYMSLKDIYETGKFSTVDYFKVNTLDGKLVASAIFYQNHPDICFAVFWGDNEDGRPARAMDYLAFNLWTYYKNLGYKYMDLGISTEAGIPNEGLLRFKETHEASSSLRYKFFWQIGS
jgi:hypothetical protein